MDTAFYLVWRNSFLRSFIRYRVLKDIEIDVDQDYLIKNHRYLSLLSPKEKFAHKIAFRWKISTGDQFKQYLESVYKEFVDELDINIINDEHVEQGSREFTNIDCGSFHDGLFRLSFFVDKYTVGHNRLPDTIVDLSMYQSFYTQDPYTSVFVDGIVAHLPKDLKSLCLPNSYTFSMPMALPDTLVELNYASTYESLKHLVVSPATDAELCIAELINEKELEWVNQQSWIRSIKLSIPNYRINQTIAPHIRKVGITCQVEFGVDSFPVDLDSLVIYNCPIPNLRGILPPRLKVLALEEYPHPIENGVLPASLEDLSIGMHQHEILPYVLPSGLKRLDMTLYNYPLQLGVLPNGLKNLCFEEFNHPLTPGVLPSTLNTFSCTYFDSTIEPNTLPASLTRLGLYSYSGPLDSFGLLPNLRELTVIKLDHSLVSVISSPSITRLKLSFEDIDPSLSLSHTHIKYLHLQFHGIPRFTLTPNFLPLSLLKLKANKININSSDIIPNGCISLDTDMKDLNIDFIPKSVKYINKNKYI
ncbi:hypothetical protein CYY_000239 [Polysphondylium violaceum]|uniref:FNIP repeat-containing protein n=1 Tax=Polysphondylium violaceum TaxID=133409 RepID=A0A8J4Q563_9MYCE|nr:hypothetical protein CYY_000239 [Polysphondylium violaceum]